MIVIRYQSATGPAFGLVENGVAFALDGDLFDPARPVRRGRKIGPLADVRLLAPVAPGKIVAVGRNYADHAKEHGGEVPPEPLLFLKAPSAVVGPGEAIRLTPLSQHVEHEAELALVIGRTAKHVPVAKAWDYVLGVTCANDVSARDLQKRDGQWARAKSLDTFCPLGPWIVTGLSLDEVLNLPITCRVNGVVKQQATAGDMVFGPATLVAHASAAMTLFPGDIILTGTPAGVSPIRAGDSVEVELGRIGILRNPVLGDE